MDVRRSPAAGTPADLGVLRRRIIASVLLADGAGVILLIVTVALAHLHLTAGAVVGLLVAGSPRRGHPGRGGTAVTNLITSVSGANPVLVFTHIPLLIPSGVLGNLTLPHGVTVAASYLPVQPVVHSVTRALQHAGAASA